MRNENVVPNNETNEQPHTVKTLPSSTGSHSSKIDRNLGVDPFDAKAAPMARRRAKPIIRAIMLLVPLVGAAVWFGLPKTQPAIMAVAENGKAELETGFAKLKALIAGVGSAAAAPLPIRGFRVMTVTIAPLNEERSYTGVIAARYETSLSFRVGGKIASRLVEVGTSVVAGTALFLLDPTDYEIALKAADAILAAAKAQQFQANADQKRQAILLKQGWTTQAAYDRVLAGSNAANDQVAAASEEVKRTQNQLKYTKLIAPESGVVTSIAVEAGQVVAQGQPVLTIAQAGEHEAVIAIPETQIAGIDEWEAEASFWSSDQILRANLTPKTATSNDPVEPIVPARIREISPQADPASRTFRARFSIDVNQDAPALGSTVTIILKRKLGRPVAIIPAAAVGFKDGKAVVWVMNETKDRAKPKQVLLVALGSKAAQVEGLASGDHIVTLGIHRLDAALPIRVAEDASMAAGGMEIGL